MDLEPHPEPVDVPLIRHWLHAELVAWTQAMFPPGRGVIAWGIFFWVWAIVQFVKWGVYLLVVLAFIMAAIVTAVWDLCTYAHRKRVANTAEWQSYMTALWGERPGT